MRNYTFGNSYRQLMIITLPVQVLLLDWTCPKSFKWCLNILHGLYTCIYGQKVKATSYLSEWRGRSNQDDFNIMTKPLNHSTLEAELSCTLPKVQSSQHIFFCWKGCLKIIGRFNIQGPDVGSGWLRVTYSFNFFLPEWMKKNSEPRILLNGQ